MNLKRWAEQQGVSYATARRWFGDGPMPVPAWQVARVTVSAVVRGLPVGRVVTEVGSALTGKRRGFLALLRHQVVTVIVAEHRGRVARFGAGYVEAALEAQGRRLLAADPSGVDDDLVRDVTEILTSLCARLYGRRTAASRAARGIAAVTGGTP